MYWKPAIRTPKTHSSREISLKHLKDYVEAAGGAASSVFVTMLCTPASKNTA
jgi:hypothetical protein